MKTCFTSLTIIAAIIFISMLPAKGQSSAVGVTVAAGFTPSDVYLDSDGSILVSDESDNVIYKFPSNSDSSTAGKIIAGNLISGSAANQFAFPSNIFLDDSGNLYVADYMNNRIQKFPPNCDSTTNAVTVAGGNDSGSAANQLNGPIGIFIDHNGNLYVSDVGNNRIQKFPSGSTSATNGITVAGGNGKGSATNQLTGPIGIVMDQDSNIYVGDAGNNRVIKFPDGSTSATNGIVVAGGNDTGSAANQLNYPTFVFIDNNNNLYISDVRNSRIQKFPAGSTAANNGVTVAVGNGSGNAANQFITPAGLYFDNNENLYVADFGNNRVQKFSNVTGIGEIENSKNGIKAQAAPNPFNIQTQITVNGLDQKFDFELYDVTGRLQKRMGSLQSNQFNLESDGLAQGVYLYRIVVNSQPVAYGKLVVQ